MNYFASLRIFMVMTEQHHKVQSPQVKHLVLKRQ